MITISTELLCLCVPCDLIDDNNTNDNKNDDNDNYSTSDNWIIMTITVIVID